MSFGGGVIYTREENGVKYGVSERDVQQALGTTVNSWDALCTHQNIKTWARYKPQRVVATYKVAEITENERAAKNYGIINIPAWSYFSKMRDFWFGNSRTDNTKPYCGILDMDEYWGYERPNGGAYPYRITDFNNYFIHANPPIGGIKEVSYEGTGIVTILFNMSYEGVTAGLTVTMSDLKNVENTGGIMTNYADYYFGVAIKADGKYYLATQGNKVGKMDPTDLTLWSMGAHVRFKVSSASNGSNNSNNGLWNCLTNNIPFQVFPLLSEQKQCYEDNNYGTVITPQTSEINKGFIAIREYEEVTLQMYQVYGEINYLDAYKKIEAAAGNRNKYAYYRFSFTNSDPLFAHNFKYSVYVYDGNGTQIASSVDQSAGNVGAGASYQKSETSIYIAEYYSAASTLKLVVSVSDPSVLNSRTDEMIVQITPPESYDPNSRDA